MSKAVTVGIGVVLVVVVGYCLWSVVGTVTPDTAPKPMLGWKCSKCSEQFQAELALSPDEAFSETDTLPKITCPKCGAPAYRLLRMRCSACKHEFEQWMAPDPATGKPPDLACPKCGDPRALPTAIPVTSR